MIRFNLMNSANPNFPIIKSPIDNHVDRIPITVMISLVKNYNGKCNKANGFWT